MIRWIDFTALPKYEKTMPQTLNSKDLRIALNDYFKKYKSYNIYSLATHLQMSNFRFKKFYLNSKDDEIKELIQMAMGAITHHAFENADTGYQRTLKYIIAQTELGQPFLEKETAEIEGNKASIVILPAKE